MSAADPRVTEALEESLRRGELGIQVAAHLHGEQIVDACAGRVEPGGEPVTSRTLFPVFSVTKAITAVALHVQAERGLVEHDAPIARYWPEFAAGGKEAITVADLLSHRSGIPWMPEGVTPPTQADWEWMVERIERMEPAFAPGTVNCYHALVWGWAVGELVRRVEGCRRGFDDFVREEILAPLGIDDVHLGLAPEHDPRVAVLVGGAVPRGVPEEYLKGMPAAVYPGAEVYNTALSRRTVNPAAGAIGTASGFSRFFALLACRGELDGIRLLSADRVDALTEPRPGVDEPDLYMGGPARVGAHGLWVGGPGAGAYPVLGDDPRIVHHPGAGGSLSWAELDTGLSVSICHNAMHDGLVDTPDHPFTPIAEAIREIAAERAR
ncbi:serine hydrolase domain-containing protein [Nocardiopsis changdeensis]|uniref:serine hydrolase domain-containing protein n=1 Tax=Nocardiopsis changdeensis TaxID=2831969 RepID=UPI003F4483FB